MAIAPPLTFTFAGSQPSSLDRERLRREGLVGFDEVEVGNRPAGLLQRVAGGRERARAHDRRVDAGRRPAGDAGERGRPRLWASASVISTRAAAPSLIPDALPAVTVPSFLKAGRGGEGFGGGAGADILVLVDHGVALAALNRDGSDLVLEAALIPGRLGLVLGGGRELVLFLAGDLILLGQFSAVMPM